MPKKRSAGFLLLVCTFAHAQSTPPANRWMAGRACRLFEGTEKLVVNRVILVNGDRIVKVGPAEKVQAPADAEVFNLGHATALPGLSDAHTHVFGKGP
ncbi:MAG TPA: hypothetical protein VFE61_01695 [Candidatus Sulfotelmatobacter sp.]|nr:hypothetical protein [Candidatus Sulfotelmatobacter sp.]